MLFNDAGFVRFRMGNDGGGNIPSQQQPHEERPQSHLSQESCSGVSGSERSRRDRLRASQSFDDSVLLVDQGKEELGQGNWHIS